MKNKYEVRGDVTAIFLKYRGDIIEALIDTEDLEKAKNIGLTWSSTYSGDDNRIYVVCKQLKNLYLHRYIMGAPKGYVVDHINNNPLDNRKSNLRIATQAENLQNYSGAYSNSKTGVRGVDWNKEKKRYTARLSINGKRIRLGYFGRLEDAEEAIKQARKQYMPYSKEAL